MLTHAPLLLSHGWLIFIWQSQEMDVHCFTCICHGFNSFSKEVMVDNYLIIASIEACALLCKFWSHKYGFSWIISSAHGGFHITIQVGVLFLLHLVTYWFCSRLCYH